MSNFDISFQPMRVDDIPVIEVLEQRCFPAPWSGETYYNELVYNQLAYYWVLRPYPPGVKGAPPILAYGGYWLMGDEAHIVTVASHPDYRRQRLAQLLMEQMIERASQGGAFDITLEVRGGNYAAQEMYKKLGFVTVGLRKKYYQDNGEDALLMTLFLLRDDAMEEDTTAAADEPVEGG